MFAPPCSSPMNRSAERIAHIDTNEYASQCPPAPSRPPPKTKSLGVYPAHGPQVPSGLARTREAALPGGGCRRGRRRLQCVPRFQRQPRSFPSSARQSTTKGGGGVGGVVICHKRWVTRASKGGLQNGQTNQEKKKKNKNK